MRKANQDGTINVFSKTVLAESDLLKLVDYPVEIESWTQMDARLDHFGEIKGYHYILRRRQVPKIVSLINSLKIAA